MYIKAAVFFACIYFSTNIFAQVDTTEYSFIKYDKNTIDSPDSVSSLSIFWSRYHRMHTTGEGQINLLHFGGSHIQADIYPNVLRNGFHLLDNLQPGARGLLFPFSAIKTNNPTNYRTRYTGTWTGQRSAVSRHVGIWGVEGVTASTTDSKASLTFSFRDTTAFEPITSILIFANLSDTTYTLDVASIPDVMATDTTEDGYLMLFFSAGQDTVFLPFVKRDSTAELHFYGCIAGSDAPGIVYHSIGGNGSSFRAFARGDLFAQQMKYMQPALVIISIGTNDTSDPDFDSLQYEQNYANFMEQILEINPSCALLLTVPNDNYVRKKYHNNNLEACRRIIYRLADKYQGAVWDFYGIMGGAYTAKTWRTAGLMKSDLVHFTNKGYLLKGNLLFEALMNDYANWQKQNGFGVETDEEWKD